MQKENASAAVYHLTTTSERGIKNINKSNKSGSLND